MTYSIAKLKIGETVKCLVYEGDHKQRAMDVLEAEKKRYEEALVHSEMTLTEMINLIYTEHATAEEKRVGKCPICGGTNLRERRDRIAVTPRGWGSISQVDPYSHCLDCGNDVETPRERHMMGEEAMKRAERKIERAKKLVKEYK